MPHVQASSISLIAATLDVKLRELFASFVGLPHPDFVLDLEHALHALARWWADAIFASWLGFLLEHTELEARVIAARRADSSRELRHKGRREVELRLLGGHCVRLAVAHLRPTRRYGRARGHGRRGRGKGHQPTPLLQALGFVRRASPALQAQTLDLSASCASVEAAREVACRRGVRRCQESWLKDLEAASSLARLEFSSWLDEPGQDSPLAGTSAAGRRIVLGFDGGRMRERVDKRGRKKANGSRNFSTDWVEPRQLVVYAIDEQGKQDRSWGKLAHASLETGKTLFSTISKLFCAIELEKAACVIVAADGQHWQWDWLREALEGAGVQGAEIVEVLDMGHALGRLSELSHLPAKWSPKCGARVGWYLKGKSLLKSGDIDGLVSHCLTLAKGSRAKKVKSLTSYFQNHCERMAYDAFERQGIPTGSGAVESMIRQVVNMRLKSCGKFWNRPNAERMLMLRSWWVVGRLEDLWRFTLRQQASWWKPSQDEDSCALDYAALFS